MDRTAGSALLLPSSLPLSLTHLHNRRPISKFAFNRFLSMNFLSYLITIPPYIVSSLIRMFFEFVPCLFHTHVHIGMPSFSFPLQIRLHPRIPLYFTKTPFSSSLPLPTVLGHSVTLYHTGKMRTNAHMGARGPHALSSTSHALETKISQRHHDNHWRCLSFENQARNLALAPLCCLFYLLLTPLYPSPCELVLHSLPT